MIEQDYGTLGTLDDNSAALIMQAQRIIPDAELRELTRVARASLTQFGVQTGIDLDSASSGQVQNILQIIQDEKPKLSADDAHTIAYAILAASRIAA